jgi:hypothetical protein
MLEVPKVNVVGTLVSTLVLAESTAVTLASQLVLGSKVQEETSKLRLVQVVGKGVAAWPFLPLKAQPILVYLR